MKKFVFYIFIISFFIFSMGTIGFTTEEISPLKDVQENIIQNGTLMAVGDISYSGIDGPIITNPDRPWVGIKDILSSATILVGNQEIPLSTRGSVYTKKTWILRSDPRTAQSLINAGFDVVTLANNHILDYGPIALQDTLKTLDEAKILHTGAGMNLNEARQPAFFVAPNGKKFAFLAYSLVFPELFWASSSRPGTPYGDPNFFIPDIKKAKALADYVIVSFHWSAELLSYQKDYQKRYGRQCIDAGASIVLGHHPHVLQGFEVYHGGLIAYSLGNFVFGSLSKKIKDSVILGIDYDQGGFFQAKIYPINVYNHEVNFQPQLRHGADAERVLEDLRTFSKEFNTKIESQGDVGIIKIRE